MRDYKFTEEEYLNDECEIPVSELPLDYANHVMRVLDSQAKSITWRLLYHTYLEINGETMANMMLDNLDGWVPREYPTFEERCRQFNVRFMARTVTGKEFLPEIPRKDRMYFGYTIKSESIHLIVKLVRDDYPNKYHIHTPAKVRYTVEQGMSEAQLSAARGKAVKSLSLVDIVHDYTRMVDIIRNECPTLEVYLRTEWLHGIKEFTPDELEAMTLRYYLLRREVRNIERFFTEEQLDILLYKTQSP